jgi:uncharacterized protein YoxC
MSATSSNPLSIVSNLFQHQTSIGTCSKYSGQFTGSNTNSSHNTFFSTIFKERGLSKEKPPLPLQLGETRIRVPLPGGTLLASDLLDSARRGLRCIDWSNITLELMTGAICGSSSMQNHFGLSRQVNLGEKIDFFMSHSWHDDSCPKLKKLQLLADSFSRKHDRAPTFWLDKVCIDQDAITDGLRALPVNIMACRKMLVLWGPTYPNRLWCAWELCTLLSFMSAEEAAERVTFVPITTEPLSTIVSMLSAFDVRDAHCFDPNEEAKLQMVIDAVGTEHFNANIRRLAVQKTQQLERQQQSITNQMNQTVTQVNQVLNYAVNEMSETVSYSVNQMNMTVSHTASRMNQTVNHTANHTVSMLQNLSLAPCVARLSDTQQDPPLRVRSKSK